MLPILQSVPVQRCRGRAGWRLLLGVRAESPAGVRDLPPGGQLLGAAGPRPPPRQEGGQRAGQPRLHRAAPPQHGGLRHALQADMWAMFDDV